MVTMLVSLAFLLRAVVECDPPYPFPVPLPFP